MQDFGWALTQMRDGKKVRRQSWESFEFITISRGEIRDEDGSVTSFTNNKALLATDWILA